MESPPGVVPVSEDELVYRRVPEAFVDGSAPSLEAFLPHKTKDVDGLSLSRQHVGAEGAAATGAAGKNHFAAELVAADIRVKGLTVYADTDDHALIPEMNSAARQSRDKEIKVRLTTWARELQLAMRGLHGPFPGKAPPAG